MITKLFLILLLRSVRLQSATNLWPVWGAIPTGAPSAQVHSLLNSRVGVGLSQASHGAPGCRWSWGTLSLDLGTCSNGPLPSQAAQGDVTFRVFYIFLHLFLCLLSGGTDLEAGLVSMFYTYWNLLNHLCSSAPLQHKLLSLWEATCDSPRERMALGCAQPVWHYTFCPPPTSASLLAHLLLTSSSRRIQAPVFLPRLLPSLPWGVPKSTWMRDGRGRQLYLITLVRKHEWHSWVLEINFIFLHFIQKMIKDDFFREIQHCGFLTCIIEGFVGVWVPWGRVPNHGRDALSGDVNPLVKADIWVKEK